MRDIAKHLRFSVSTVSRSLRRAPGVNAKTRARVLQAADRMGYRAVRSYCTAPLETKKLHHVGVLVATSQYWFASSYITGVSDASIQLNASLVIHYSKPEQCEHILNPECQPPAMRMGLVAGLILAYHWPEHVVSKLAETFPIVSIIHTYPDVDHDLIGLDDHRGVETIVRHLYSLGHRKIGFLGRCREVEYATRRFGAYVSALAKQGIEYRPDWVIDVDENRLIDPNPKLDLHIGSVTKLVHEDVRAWICATETVGWELHASLAAQNFRIPEDVSIAGFHRPEGMTPWGPDLPSVSASYEAMGAAALKRLMYRMQNPAESTRTILFPPVLYPGKTSAPPPHCLQEQNWQT
jgi:DNA-binding LacI/PurR family transcriptional regulator